MNIRLLNWVMQRISAWLQTTPQSKLPQSILSPQAANPNLLLTYERTKQSETLILNDSNSIVNKVTAALAVFGIVITGILSAIDKLAWGFIQYSNHRDYFCIFLPNLICAVVAAILAIQAGPQLSKIYHGTNTLYP